MRHLLPLIFLLLLLSSCTPNSEPTPTYDWQRADFTDRNFSGQIDGEPVSANLTLEGEMLTGTLTFEKTGTRRKLDGNLSFEGFFRVLGRPEKRDTSMAITPGGKRASKGRGVFLSTGRIVGFWNGAASIGEVPMVLGTPQSEFFEVKAAEEDQEEELIFSHWIRSVTCINSERDTMGQINIQIPRISAKTPTLALQTIFNSLVMEMVYNQKCTCRALQNANSTELFYRIEAPKVQAGLLNLDLVYILNGKESQHLYQVYDLQTGQQLSSSEESSNMAL